MIDNSTSQNEIYTQEITKFSSQFILELLVWEISAVVRHDVCNEIFMTSRTDFCYFIFKLIYTIGTLPSLNFLFQFNSSLNYIKKAITPVLISKSFYHNNNKGCVFFIFILKRRARIKSKLSTIFKLKKNTS